MDEPEFELQRKDDGVWLIWNGPGATMINLGEFGAVRDKWQGFLDEQRLASAVGL